MSYINVAKFYILLGIFILLFFLFCLFINKLFQIKIDLDISCVHISLTFFIYTVSWLYGSLSINHGGKDYTY